MNKLANIYIFPETRDDINNFVEQTKLAIIEGEQDPLLILKKLKSLEEIATKVKKDPEINELILKEADKYKENTIEIHGCKFTKQERPTYDYSECNDHQLKLAYQQRDQIDAWIKGREAYLKTLKEATPDIETGDLLQPPTKTSKSILAVTLK
jgi:hypothetical protein